MSLINWRRSGDILPAWSSMVDNLFDGSDDFLPLLVEEGAFTSRECYGIRKKL